MQSRVHGAKLSSLPSCISTLDVSLVFIMPHILTNGPQNSVRPKLSCDSEQVSELPSWSTASAEIRRGVQKLVSEYST
jgi:hypothetical protein